jgi:hypothetical protein
MSNIAQLKERVLTAEARVEHLQSLVDAFFTGDVPEGSSLQHAVLAQWGRRRLDEKRVNKLAVLFQPV